MSSKASSSLKELKGLREAVLAEEKARTQALLQNLPEGPNESPAQDTVVPASFDRPLEEIEVPEPSPPPLVAKSPEVQPAPARSAPSRPVPPAGARPKANKEAALIIPLTPRIQERLQRNVENARWNAAELVMELIRVTLHQGYPAIQSGEELIASAGTYRTYERNPLETSLKIISGQGVFDIGVKPQNPEYQHWFSYFTNQKTPDPEKSAQQVCLFTLQSYLEGMEDFKSQGWTKQISPENYTVVSSG